MALGLGDLVCKCVEVEMYMKMYIHVLVLKIQGIRAAKFASWVRRLKIESYVTGGVLFFK